MKRITGNLLTGRYRSWVISLVIMLGAVLIMSCTKHEYIDLPFGNIEGSIAYSDINNNNYPYPGTLFQIKAQCDTSVFLVSSDKNGNFSFSNLPSGGYSFTLIGNNKELINIDNCSFLGGGKSSDLNFYFRIQPNIKNIDYHFEIINDTLWVLGQVELDGVPPIESNEIMLFLSSPPDTTLFFPRIITFDWKTGQINYMLSEVHDTEKGLFINSYIYKKYKEYGVTFRNYTIMQNYFVYSYVDENHGYRITSDSTSTYKFIFP